MQEANDYTKTVYILLIDDDEDEKEIFQLAASKNNLPVTVNHITDCRQEYLTTMPKPDFIFLDINMPGHDGFSWLDAIRQKIAAPIPVIMYSTTGSTEKVRKAYDLGANLFVSKPATSSALSTILTRILELDWSDPKKLREESFAADWFHFTAG